MKGAIVMNNLFYLEKSSEGTKEINLKTKMMDNRVLFLDGEVNKESVMELCQAMLIMSTESPAPITLVINSPGGSISDGLALLETMRCLPCEVITVCFGMAASMGAVLLAAGARGKRYILRHSKTMIHETLISNGIGGSCSSIASTSQNLIKTKELINRLLADFCEKSIEEIDEATAYDNHLNTEESVEFGLCDRILENRELYTVLIGKGE